MNETDFRKLISGERRGLSAALLRSMLWVASLFYALAIHLRNLAYNLGLRRVHRVGVPVVSVGNITTGGTGKTPAVAWIANWYRERGTRVAIVSRGYRSLDGQANDEKLVLEQLCPGVPHEQDPDRVAAARRAIDDHGAELLILDDGFQHRRLGRDLDIVLIDCTNPFGYGHLLPRGLLREPIASTSRSQLTLLTRAETTGGELCEQMVRHGMHLDSPVRLQSRFAATQLRKRDEQGTPFAALAGRRLLAFCGIGNPDAFRATLSTTSLNPVHFREYPDHHHYSWEDLDELAALADRHEIDAFVTTQKDAVKIHGGAIGGRDLWAVEIGIEFSPDAQPLTDELERLLPK